MGERRRSFRALANDKAILLAAVNEIVRVGVDRISLRDVGRVAGLTHGASYARYEDVTELLVDVWGSVLNERLITMYDLAHDVALSSSPRAVGELFEYIRRADCRDRAAIEVLLVSRRFPALLEETEGFIHEYLERGDEQSATRSRTALLFGLVLVQIFSNAQFEFDNEYQSALEKLLIETLSATGTESLSRSSTTERVHGLDDLGECDWISSDGEMSSQLTQATCDVVGTSGYVRATLTRIARRSDCSSSLIYKSHRSKEGLVIRVCAELLADRQLNKFSVEDLLDAGSLADVLRSEVSDGNVRRRNFSLEVAIAAGHNDIMRSPILGEILQGESARKVLVQVPDERDQRLDYAIRTVFAVVTAVSWIATVTHVLDAPVMDEFAESMRFGLLNQWFPDVG